MPSGRKLTEPQRDTILRLAGDRDAAGEWLLTYEEIAQRLQLNRRTVYRCIREAAVKWGRFTAWRSDPEGCS
jgi:excisionase family DNA binding protein